VTTMQQAWIPGPGEVGLRTVDRPSPSTGEVLVATAQAGICGSDLHALAGKHPFIDLPCTPGHEAAGTVVEVGSEVDGFASGDRVLLEPNLICGRCWYCTSGRYNLCEQLLVVGCQTAGALADVFTVPAHRLHHVPDGMSWTAATMVEPMSTAVHATRLVGDLTGAVVAVLGAGPIGLLTLLAARAAGAAAIAATDPIEAKRARATDLGAELTVDPTEAGAVAQLREGLPRRPDVVFDCVANQASMDQAIALALKGGTVVVVGVPNGAVTIPLELIQDREVRIQGSAMYTGDDVRAAIDLVAREPAVEGLVTARFPLADAAEAFAAARSGQHVKVHVVVGTDESS
jgi:L-iditol 2-dehydrogenase